jgi:hypothetical protein
MRFKLFSLHSAISIAASFLLTGMALASDAGGKSGLDLDRGYDVNTVATVTGKVIATHLISEREGIIVEISSSSEKVHLSVGPSSYWEKHGIPLRLNDDITAKGSKSQGKDGKIYLLVRKLENRTTGSQVEMRDGQGEAAWNGANIHPGMSERPSGGQRQGGGMMRGGGGMMRR